MQLFKGLVTENAIRPIVQEYAQKIRKQITTNVYIKKQKKAVAEERAKKRASSKTAKKAASTATASATSTLAATTSTSVAGLTAPTTSPLPPARTSVKITATGISKPSGVEKIFAPASDDDEFELMGDDD